MDQKPRRFRVKHVVSDDVTLDLRDVDLMRGKWYLRIDYGRASAFRFESAPDGKQHKRALHRIVAERHCPKPSSEHDVVEALDGNKLNCRSSNLEWRRKDDTDFKRRRGAEPDKAPATKPEPTYEERRAAALAKAEWQAARRKEWEDRQAEFIRTARLPAK